MSFDFKNKVVLVTGATSGIGKTTAIEFARAGASVVITGRREEKGEEVLAELNKSGGDHVYIKADAASEADNKSVVDQIVAKYGKLDVAFNNAGVEDQLKPLHEATEKDIDFVLGVNVKGVILGMKYELLQMQKQSTGGSIINMSSVGGQIGFPNAGVYVASKHAVNGITRSAALENAKVKIRVNAVAPGPIATDMLQRFADEVGGGDINSIGGMTAIGVPGKTEDIAAAVLFLASDEAAYITGQILPIDGGMTTA